MQARTRAIGEGDIMDAALAVCPGRPELTAFLVFRIFRHPKAKLVVEGDRGIDIR